MTVLVEIPLDGGLVDSVDAKLAPDGVLKVAENVILRRDGQLEVRPGDTALSMDDYNGGTLSALDVASYNERLVAFSQDDIHEYVDAAEAWRPSGGAGTSLLRLPFITGVRDLGGAPDQDGDATACSVAATGDFVAMAFSNGTNGYLHVVRASTDQTVLFQRLPSGISKNLHVVATSTGLFWVIGENSANTIVQGSPFDPTSDTEAGGTLKTLASSLGTIVATAVAPIENGSGGFVLAVATATGNSLLVFEDDGDQSGSTITGPAESTRRVALCADETADRIHLMWQRVSSPIWQLQTYEFDGGDIEGPTSLFDGDVATDGPGGVAFGADGAVVCAGSTQDAALDDSLPCVHLEVLDGDSHESDTSDRHANSSMLAGPIVSGDDVLFTWTKPSSGRRSNMLSTWRECSIGGATHDFVQLVCKDFELAALSRGGLVLLGSKLYWGSVVTGNDGQLSPRLTELELKSGERRQTAELGGLLYIAGGQPSQYDGRMVVEEGFTERPEIRSSTAGTTGLLTQGGRYTHAVTWEWLDAGNNLHRSPPSEFKEVTLTGSNRKITHVVTTPHSQRCNRTAKNGQGSAVRAVLWRNTCPVTRTAASVTTAPVNPPSVVPQLGDPNPGELNGLTILISVDSGSYQSVQFDGDDDDPTNIAATINSATTGLTATVDGDTVIISSDTTGESSRLLFAGHAGALSALGLSFGLDVTGTETAAPGVNLHRVKSVIVGDQVNYGSVVSIEDTASDSSIEKNEVLYTISQTPVPHHAPQPHDYVWPAGDALLAGGLPQRSAWVRSKRLFTAEPVHWAEPGRLNFGGRANTDITAVAVLDQSNLLFQRSSLQTVEGEGPDHSGNGEFFAPGDVPIDGGALNWRSLLRTSEGLFCVLDDGKLFLLRRGGAAEWVGFAVQDVLEAYPEIVGATLVRAQHHVCFACNDSAGTGGVILRYDLRRKVWFTHTVSGALRGIAQHQGRLVYVLASGVVMRADAAPGSGTFVPYKIRTGSFGGFQSLGYGSVHKVGVLGELRGACSIEALMSYDDGRNFVTMDERSLSGTAGTTVAELWTPPTARTDRFVLELRVSGDSGSAGVRLNKILFEVEQAPVVSLAARRS